MVLGLVRVGIMSPAEINNNKTIETITEFVMVFLVTMGIVLVLMETVMCLLVLVMVAFGGLLNSLMLMEYVPKYTTVDG